jgi:glutaredoxin
MAKFAGLNAQVMGISVDSVPCLQAWSESLGDINYPLLSDFWPHGAVAEMYGVLQDNGEAERAIFLVDKEGIIQYIDIHDIDDQPDNEELFIELRRIDPDAAASATEEPEANKLPHGGIVMYCSSWCPSCKKARKWLEEHGFYYIEINVNEVPAAAKQVREWADGNLVVPPFDIDGEVILDFDLEKLSEILL